MQRRSVGLALLIVCAGAGCASRTARTPTVAGAADASIDAYVARVRARSWQAAATRLQTTALSLEASNPALRAALDRLALSPTPEAHHAVAAAYLTAGIVDQAFNHLTSARRLDRSDATAYDGLARIWRDWGFPHLGLADAHRAVYFAPASASARNTLGTLLQALGEAEAARAAYRAALRLDPRAAYALNNLCALDLREGRLAAAEARCRQALGIDPGLLAARRNLAVLAALEPARGDRTAARPVADGPAKPPGE